MDNNEKIETIKAYLSKHGYKLSNVEDTWPEGTLLVVKRPRVAICEATDTQRIFPAISQRHAAAVFLREEETVEFTMLKLRNSLRGRRLADLNKPRPPRKRIRITRYEKVERR